MILLMRCDHCSPDWLSWLVIGCCAAVIGLLAVVPRRQRRGGR